MVKKRVGGAQRYASKASGGAAAKASRKHGAGGSASAEPAAAAGAPPKHLQRKIARKVGFLDKVAASSKAVALARAGVAKPGTRRRAGTTLQNLSTLSGVLEEVQQDVLTKAKQQQAAAGGKAKGGQGTFGQSVHSGRARSAVQATETARLQQVLQHPVFQSNPIGAIMNHLKSTLPAAPPAPAAVASSRKGGAPLSKQARKGKQQARGPRGPGDVVDMQ